MPAAAVRNGHGHSADCGRLLLAAALGVSRSQESLAKDEPIRIKLRLRLHEAHSKLSPVLDSYCTCVSLFVRVACLDLASWKVLGRLLHY